MSGFHPWRIVHVRLDGDFPELPREANLGGVHLVFWMDDLPLGDAEISSERLPLSATQVREIALRSVTAAVGDRLLEQGFRAAPAVKGRAAAEPPPPYAGVSGLTRPLATLQRRLQTDAPGDGAPAALPRVSVVVCTRERSESLERCLASLAAADPPADETIVVDNAPTSDDTRGVVAHFPGVRYVREPRPGLSAARNTGIRSASGDIIAFTDDDVAVHPHWVLRVRSGFEQPDIVALTGLVLPAALESESQWLFEKGFGGFSQGFRRLTFDAAYFERMKRFGVPVWRIGAGANMAFRRRAFEEVGGFDERLGAGAAGCSEDSELWYRLLAAGWRCRYDPAAVVFHHHRAESAGLGAQMQQYMRGHVAALLVQFAGHRHWGNLNRLLFALPLHFAELAAGGLLWERRPKHLFLRERIAGFGSGIAFYLRNRRRSLDTFQGVQR